MLFRLLAFLRGPAAADPGARGERLAAEWLRRERGFAILARNWRNPRDQREELDLVCEDEGVLVFVEVKARSARALVPGVHAVDARKKRVLRRAASAYLAGLARKPATFRLDVVEVTWPEAGPAGSKPAEPQILHFENVELFGKHFRG
jgi:putative endonuclease